MAPVRRRRVLVRQPYWERRLVAWADAQIGKSFAWGETDCGTLAVEAVRVMCGPDSLDPRARQYKTRIGALRATYQIGSVRAHLARLGFREFPIVFAQHGDLIVRPRWSGNSLEEVAVLVSGRLLSAVESLGVHWTSEKHEASVAMRA